MSVLVPKQKQVVLVMLVWPAEAAVEQVVTEEPRQQQGVPEGPRLQPVEPEEPLVPDPCSHAVDVLAVHDERIELVLRRCLIVICLRRGSVLLFYDRPVRKQVVGARNAKCFKNKFMICVKLSDARVIVDVQSALFKVTGSFGLGRMT